MKAGIDAEGARPRPAIDLFAGAGGFSLGAIAAGFEIRAAVELDRHASRTYARGVRNPSGRAIEVFRDDIRELSPERVLDRAGLEPGDCDLLLDGPPCQGFSLHRAGRAGLPDARNALLPVFLDWIAAMRPRAFLAENVPGLLQPRHAARLESFLDGAARRGYAIDGPVMLNARDFGVPQNRRRVFVLGRDRRRGIAVPCWPPAPTHGDPDRIAATGSACPLPWRTASVAFRPPSRPDDPNDLHMRHGEALVEAFRNTPPNGGSRAQSGRALPCHEGHDGHRDVYGRIDPDRPAPTMTTGSGGAAAELSRRLRFRGRPDGRRRADRERGPGAAGGSALPPDSGRAGNP